MVTSGQRQRYQTHRHSLIETTSDGYTNNEQTLVRPPTLQSIDKRERGEGRRPELTAFTVTHMYALPLILPLE